MMVIENKFDLTETVYIKTDTDQLARIVCGILVLPQGIIYELACGVNMSKHYDFELSREKDTVMAVK